MNNLKNILYKLIGYIIKKYLEPAAKAEAVTTTASGSTAIVISELRKLQSKIIASENIENEFNMYFDEINTFINKNMLEPQQKELRKQNVYKTANEKSRESPNTQSDSDTESDYENENDNLNNDPPPPGASSGSGSALAPSQAAAPVSAPVPSEDGDGVAAASPAPTASPEQTQAPAAVPSPVPSEHGDRVASSAPDPIADPTAAAAPVPIDDGDVQGTGMADPAIEAVIKTQHNKTLNKNQFDKQHQNSLNKGKLNNGSKVYHFKHNRHRKAIVNAIKNRKTYTDQNYKYIADLFSSEIDKIVDIIMSMEWYKNKNNGYKNRIKYTMSGNIIGGVDQEKNVANDFLGIIQHMMQKYSNVVGTDGSKSTVPEPWKHYVNVYTKDKATPSPLTPTSTPPPKSLEQQFADLLQTQQNQTPKSGSIGASGDQDGSSVASSVAAGHAAGDEAYNKVPNADVTHIDKKNNSIIEAIQWYAKKQSKHDIVKTYYTKLEIDIPEIVEVLMNTEWYNQVKNKIKPGNNLSITNQTEMAQLFLGEIKKRIYNYKIKGLPNNMNVEDKKKWNKYIDLIYNNKGEPAAEEVPVAAAVAEEQQQQQQEVKEVEEVEEQQQQGQNRSTVHALTPEPVDPEQTNKTIIDEFITNLGIKPPLGPNLIEKSKQIINEKNVTKEPSKLEENLNGVDEYINECIDILLGNKDVADIPEDV